MQPAIWRHIWKCTEEQSQTIVTSVTMHPDWTIVYIKSERVRSNIFYYMHSIVYLFCRVLCAIERYFSVLHGIAFIHSKIEHNSRVCCKAQKIWKEKNLNCNNKINFAMKYHICFKTLYVFQRWYLAGPLGPVVA